MHSLVNVDIHIECLQFQMNVQTWMCRSLCFGHAPLNADNPSRFGKLRGSAIDAISICNHSGFMTLRQVVCEAPSSSPWLASAFQWSHTCLRASGLTRKKADSLAHRCLQTFASLLLKSSDTLNGKPPIVGSGQSQRCPPAPTQMVPPPPNGR